MEGLDIESNSQRIVFHMRYLNITVIKKAILIVQDVLAQIRSNLFVRKDNLAFVDILDHAENSKEMGLNVKPTVDVKSPMLLAQIPVVISGVIGNGGQQPGIQHFHLRQDHVPIVKIWCNLEIWVHFWHFEEISKRDGSDLRKSIKSIS